MNAKCHRLTFAYVQYLDNFSLALSLAGALVNTVELKGEGFVKVFILKYNFFFSRRVLHLSQKSFLSIFRKYLSAIQTGSFHLFSGHMSFCSSLLSGPAFDLTEPFPFMLNYIFFSFYFFLRATFPFIYKTVKKKSMLFSVRQAAETWCPDTMCPDYTSPCQSNKKITATHFAFQCIFMKCRRDSNTSGDARHCRSRRIVCAVPNLN